MTERSCVTCGQTITVTTRNPTRRFCSPRCRVADWHARNNRRQPNTTNDVPPTGNAVPNEVPNAVPTVAPAGTGVPAANGVQHCPHCHHELAVIAVIIPAEAAHVLPPEVITTH
jgi:endogenous inhibitor of DNA gyrase (YacG/DUF329 family)